MPAWSGSPTPAKTTTWCCRPWPTGSAPVSSTPPPAWTRPARELDEYFTGRRRSFDLPLDWRLSAGFRRAVLSHLPEIGYGHTASYAAVASLAGNPKAVRAAATACATNPLPVVVPCHRVIYSDGRIGRYLGGPDAKRTLLALEAQHEPHCNRDSRAPGTVGTGRAVTWRDRAGPPTGTASAPNSTPTAAA